MAKTRGGTSSGVSRGRGSAALVHNVPVPWRSAHLADAGRSRKSPQPAGDSPSRASTPPSALNQCQSPEQSSTEFLYFYLYSCQCFWLCLWATNSILFTSHFNLSHQFPVLLVTLYVVLIPVFHSWLFSLCISILPAFSSHYIMSLFQLLFIHKYTL